MRRRSQRAALVLVIVVVTLGVLQTPVLSTARGWTWGWWSGVVSRWSGSVALTTEGGQRESTLLAENLRLHAELHDYQRLRQQLGTPSFEGFRAVPVAVVGRPLDAFHSLFLLSKGARDGLVLGAPLVIQGSTLVGFITELKETTAVGQLLLAPETTLSVQVEPDGATGLVQGRQYTSLWLTTVPRDVSLREHQVVVTEAKPAVVPFGLVVGTITSIQSSDNAVYQEAVLSLPYDVDSLRAGVVLLPR